LGWLFGDRFLMLTHTGRKSGKQRYVVIEVVYHEPDTGVYYVSSGWGTKSDWYKNIMKTPQVTVQVRNHSFPALAKQVSVEQAEEKLFAYAQRYPAAFRELTMVMTSKRLDPTLENCRKLAEAVPVIAFIPQI
jgi:deazaflavin-dependent oxidoreductase (nitroreductase family)